ncbi:MAG: dihydroorotase [Candidatus Aminicenantes bacterium]|nr:dihydroorotase [Candidatus Aminicenantes bacterium]
MSLLIRNGRVIDPASGLDETLDILIEGGRIADLQPRIEARGAETIDASRLVVAPGFIDLHVHLRDPGQTAKETIASGGRAAAKGGFTTICPMPNTRPPHDHPDVTEHIKSEAARAGLVRVLPIGALTKGLLGAELANMAALSAAGCVAFSDDGKCVQNSRLMLRALERARDLGTLIIDHAEDASLADGGIIHEGPVSRRLGLPGIPSAAEEVMVARDILLAEAAGARIHIAHVSTKGAAGLIREAKRRGVRVTAEAAPHHLLLTEADLEGRDPNFKMNPPLRGAEDVAALRAAVQDGTIDAFATDHAPHTPAEKAAGIESAPFGVVGLETAVSVLLDRLVHGGLIPLDRFVAMWTVRPAEILGLDGPGRIAVGGQADLTLLNLRRTVVVEAAEFASLGRNTPFQGWKLRGAPVRTIRGGRVIYPFPA